MTFQSLADRAELDVLVHELVEQAWPHRDKPGFEQALAEALDVVLAWRRGRELRTIATRLRAEQDIADWLNREPPSFEQATDDEPRRDLRAAS